MPRVAWVRARDADDGRKSSANSIDRCCFASWRVATRTHWVTWPVPQSAFLATPVDRLLALYRSTRSKCANYVGTRTCWRNSKNAVPFNGDQGDYGCAGRLGGLPLLSSTLPLVKTTANPGGDCAGCPSSCRSWRVTRTREALPRRQSL